MTEKEMALRLDSLMTILREEYGIETREQLAKAISELEPIDISVFVCPPLGKIQQKFNYDTKS